MFGRRPLMRWCVICSQTDRQTDRQNEWSQYSATQPWRRNGCQKLHYLSEMTGKTWWRVAHVRLNDSAGNGTGWRMKYQNIMAWNRCNTNLCNSKNVRMTRASLLAMSCCSCHWHAVASCQLTSITGGELLLSGFVIARYDCRHRL